MPIISNGGMSSVNTPDTMDAVMLTKNIHYIDGVKLDVRQSLDGEIVLAKDDDLAKWTLSKEKVSNSNYDYLRKVKFPSHIFKYFIPKLEEILKRYNREKIIVLELFNQSDNPQYLNNLYQILIKYPYQYIFLVDSEGQMEMLKEKYSKLGQIILKNAVVYLNNNNFSNYDLNSLNMNDLIITDCPTKIYKSLLFRQN